jgi:hypothetical protein
VRIQDFEAADKIVQHLPSNSYSFIRRRWYTFCDEELPMQSESPADILLLPGLLFVIGAIIYLVAYVKSVDFDEMPKFRWSALGFLGVSLIFGIQNEWKMFNPTDGSMYRDVSMKKVLYSNHASFALPLIGLIVIAILEQVVKRRARLID